MNGFAAFSNDVAYAVGKNGVVLKLKATNILDENDSNDSI
jgi:hypothetical protein